MKHYQLTDKYLDRLACVIDNALDYNNEEMLKKFIDKYLNVIENSQRAYGFYLIGNTYNGIRNIKYNNNKQNIWNLKQEEVFNEIYYFRKAILQKDFNSLDLSIRLAIYVNLGNTFSHYGRTINAIKYYDKAIDLNTNNKNIIYHTNYFMALINKAYTLENYEQLDYDDGHGVYFIKFAYKLYKNAITKFEENQNKYYIDLSILNDIIRRLNYYNQIKDIEDIEYFLNYKSNFSKNENKYRKWCLLHKLFLNTLNELGNYDISTYDPLNLPNIITNEPKFPIIITNFNQIKQEFISYRHLLFEGINAKTPKFYDRETSISDDYDYNLYDINIEKIKLSFRGFYSIFDKIANFINEYFCINIPENKVNFRSIWLDKNQINDMFNKSQNLALRGLYLISKDLFFYQNDENSKKFIEVIEPEAQKINEIRNHLEHKFISIKVFDSELLNMEDRKRNFSISKDELEEKTIHLAQLVREALIYLSFAIHIEEKKKNISSSLCCNMPLNLTK